MMRKPDEKNRTYRFETCSDLWSKYFVLFWFKKSDTMYWYLLIYPKVQKINVKGSRSEKIFLTLWLYKHCKEETFVTNPDVPFTFTDTYKEKVPSNKTSTLSESMNMDIWVVGTSNQPFIRGS